MKASGGTDGALWLLLQFLLPPGKSSGRVAVWRRLRALGALGLGPATYALPDDAESRESFEWLRRDIEELGGEALLFAARPVDAAVAAALERRRQGEAAPAGGPRRRPVLARLDPARYRGRTWVTRPRPGVDRMASAWLIRRFIDPEARFDFSDTAGSGRGKAIPFDTFGAELGHQQGLCTFEVLARRFGVDDRGVAALARTVHAVDLHEAAPDAAEAAMVERLVDGLRASHSDDRALLEAGIALFEALHASSRGRQRRAPAAQNAPKAIARKRRKESQR